MLHYLKIFSWFLFTFGIVGIIALLAGMEPTVTTARKALGLMAMQLGVSSLLLIGFRMYKAEQLPRKALLYTGWGLIVLLVVVGQVWLNV
ncbi:hypothetical protein [Gilvimarinus agarilyticus]|uniref:hypothetical protein n=1 Tax=Gilvimarinus agarilyticus TaxID=679259 RepID=UPI0005A2144B|nr:hypothetical protein [Gilvimarinus agarilyticus]